MKSPPRVQGQMVNKDTLLSIAISGLVRGCLAVGAFYMVYSSNEGNPMQHEKAVTATFVTIIITQFINIFSMRTTEFIVSRYLFSNIYLFAGILSSSLLMLTITYVPFFNHFLHTGPLSIIEWCYPLLAAGLYLVGYETIKFGKRWRNRQS